MTFPDHRWKEFFTIILKEERKKKYHPRMKKKNTKKFLQIWAKLLAISETV